MPAKCGKGGPRVLLRSSGQFAFPVRIGRKLQILCGASAFRREGYMRVLLDTNIVIHREAATVVKSSIGVLFRWLDRLKHEKCIHPGTIQEISRHQDERVRRSFATKLESYAVLGSPPHWALLIPCNPGFNPLSNFSGCVEKEASSPMIN
jgi:hypothetical protein